MSVSPPGDWILNRMVSLLNKTLEIINETVFTSIKNLLEHANTFTGINTFKAGINVDNIHSINGNTTFNSEIIFSNITTFNSEIIFNNNTTFNSEIIVSGNIIGGVVLPDDIHCNDIHCNGNIRAETGITTPGTITTGNITTSGTITTGAHVISGNLAALTHITANGNITTQAHVIAGTITTGNITTSGTITTGAHVISGNLAALTHITANGNITTQAHVIAGTITTGNITATGNIITQANVIAGTDIIATGNIITQANVIAGTHIIATGNIITQANVIAETIIAETIIAGNTDYFYIGYYISKHSKFINMNIHEHGYDALQLSAASVLNIFTKSKFFSLSNFENQGIGNWSVGIDLNILSNSVDMDYIVNYQNYKFLVSYKVAEENLVTGFSNSLPGDYVLNTHVGNQPIYITNFYSTQDITLYFIGRRTSNAFEIAIFNSRPADSNSSDIHHVLDMTICKASEDATITI